MVVAPMAGNSRNLVIPLTNKKKKREREKCYLSTVRARTGEKGLLDKICSYSSTRSLPEVCPKVGRKREEIFSTYQSPINGSHWLNRTRNQLVRELFNDSSQGPASQGREKSKDLRKVRREIEMLREVNTISTVRLSLARTGQNEKITMRLLISNFSRTLISPREERFYFLHDNKKKRVCTKLKYL